MLLPGDTLRFPIGTGAAELRLWGGKNWGFYELASTVAAFIPGSPSTYLQAFTALIKELNDDFTQYHTCERRAGSVLRRVGCQALLARNVAFAIGRAGISALAKGAVAAVLSGVTFSRWVSSSVGDVGVLVHSGAIRFKAATVPPTLPPSYASVPLATLCETHEVQLHAVNGCPYIGTSQIGTDAFERAILIEDNNESALPTYWNLIDFPATTCNSIDLTFGMPTDGSQPGDTASIQVTAQTLAPQSASVGYGQIGKLEATLDGHPWSLENAATNTYDKIAINGVASCSTPSGY